MSGRITAVLIIISWLTMMFGLTRDEVVPIIEHAREISQSARYDKLDKFLPESRVDQMGLYMGGQRLGQAVRWLERDDDEITIRTQTDLDLSKAPVVGVLREALDSALRNFAGGSFKMRFTFQATVLKGRLQQCNARVYAPPGSPALARIEGHPRGDKLRLTFRYGKESQVKEVPFDQRQILHNTMAPGMRFEGLRIGKRWRIKSLNTFSSSVESAWATVTGRESIVIDGETINAYVVDMTQGLYRMRMWVAPGGELLKQQFMTFTFIRETPSEAARKELKQ